MKTIDLGKLICSAWFGASVLLVPCAVGSESRYSYSSIIEEYADTFCRQAEISGVSTGSDADVCILDQPVSLKTAVRIALLNNPDSQMALARVAQAEAQCRKADSAFYPSLGFYTEYMQGDSPSAYLFKTIDQRKFASSTDFNSPGWFENYESGVQGRINLFNGGRDILNSKITKAGLTISQEDRRAVENALTASVIRAYYDYLAAEDFIDISKESAATVGSELDIMKIRLKAGGALKSDVLSLEVRLAEALENVVRSRNQLKMTMAVFANLLGVSPDKQIVLIKDEMRQIVIPEDYEAGVRRAIDMRPELRKVREALRQSRMAHDSATSQYLPNIDLMGKYYLDDPHMRYHRDRENWTMALVLNWDLFTGFSTPADRAKSTAGIEEALAADRKTLLSIQLDVKNAYLRLDEARARLDVARKSVASAEESLVLVKKQFEGGSATITRYLEAELSRNTARIRSTRAFYDREQAVAEIGRAIGLLAKGAS